MNSPVPFALSALVLLSGSSSACGPKSALIQAPDRLQAYVNEAKQSAAAVTPAEGSLWTGRGRQANLFRDFKAREVNDIVTIRVSESTSANAKADTKNTKATESKAGFDNLFGAEKLIKELPTAISGKASSSFTGEGSTNRTTSLTTTISARVADVLPNGNLLIEGARQIYLNDETQTVYLTGVVRPEDISAANIVSSSSVAQMVVSLHGKGSVSRPLKAGWLYKILNGVLPF